jgi:hypothetical protein
MLAFPTLNKVGLLMFPCMFDSNFYFYFLDRCEPFDTHPRTYDLLHASGLFSIEKRR